MSFPPMSSGYTRLVIQPHCYRNIPSKPGVYRFLSDYNQILYTGASSNLQKRIAQHLRKYSNKEHRKLVMISQSAFLEYQCYSTAEEAFSAEEKEIWVHQPMFNKKGVHPKAFSYLIIREDPHPHIACVRGEDYDRISKSETFFRINLYYLELIERLTGLRKLFRFCICPSRSSSKSCWENQLDLCVNQCRHNVKTFRGNKDLIKVLSGKNKVFVRELEESMQNSVENLEFEHAQKTHIMLRSIKSIQDKFGGEGIKRNTDHFILEPLSLNSRKFKIKFAMSSNGNNSNFPSNLNYRTVAIVENEDKFTPILKSFYLKLHSPPKRIEIVAPRSIFQRNPFWSNLLGWLKLYFSQEIALNLIS
ncbi:MAG: GIY-YIG nuclease family protein [Candidatus Thorarchaeota archaeon]